MEKAASALSGPARRLRLAAAAGRVCVGALLLVAAGLKVTQAPVAVGRNGGADAFMDIIARQHILPAWSVGPVAYGTVLGEIAVGSWLLSHRGVRWAAAAGVGMMASFACYLIILKYRGADPACGCFGRLETGEFVVSLLRNVVMSGCLALSFDREIAVYV